MSFDPKIIIVVRSRIIRFASETGDQLANATKVEVQLPLTDLVTMNVSLKANVQSVQERLVCNFGVQGSRRLILLGSDLKRLAPNERVWGLRLPLTAAKPVAILSLAKRGQPSDVIEFPCLQADKVDHLKDFLAQKRPTADSRAIVLLNGSEPPGGRNLMRLSHPNCHWEFDFARLTRSRSTLSFNVTFDRHTRLMSELFGIFASSRSASIHSSLSHSLRTTPQVSFIPMLMLMVTSVWAAAVLSSNCFSRKKSN
jgi:hypothetical protein